MVPILGFGGELETWRTSSRWDIESSLRNRFDTGARSNLDGATGFSSNCAVS
jgi:hypothetical protein